MKKKENVSSNIDNKINKKSIAFGAAVLCFAFIGVITVIALIVNMFVSVFDKTPQKKEFEKFLTPLIMADPVAFDKLSDADEHTLLMSSMWNLLLNVGEDTNYPEDEYGMMIIPSSDLDVSAANLFGSKVSLSHQTFDNNGVTFEYNADKNSYIVPPMGFVMQYQPRVDNFKKKGKTYTLNVSYVNTNSAIVAEDNKEASADKEMIYVLKKTGKKKFIVESIKTAENKSNKKDKEHSKTSSLVSSKQFVYESSQIAD